MSAQPATLVKLVKSQDGTTIYADAVGVPGKQGLVFLHGFALSGIVFDELFTNPRLVDNFYLVRYDMRGHGRSGKPNKPEDHVSSRYAEDFIAVADAFGLVKPIFVGWSLGAAIIGDIATISPMPISGAVALSGCPIMGPEIVPKFGTAKLLEVLPKFLGASTPEALASRVDFIDSCFDSPSDIPFSLRCALLGATVLQPPELSGLTAMRSQDPAKLFEAGGKGFPLQILSGVDDKLVDGAAVVEEVKPYFTNLTVSLIQGSHSLFYDNQEGMIDELLKFVLKTNTNSEEF